MVRRGALNANVDTSCTMDMRRIMERASATSPAVITGAAGREGGLTPRR